MSRRAFLYGAIALLAAPGRAETQQTTKVYRVGFLRNGPPPEPSSTGCGGACATSDMWRAEHQH